ncbi:MAG TPA: hypothetical protein DCZ73_08150 [Bacteroides sp.]|nr:Bax inhibitor-1/YccA family protein [Phocaeicola coprophilus]HBB07717.1 hypothetical protein [Bacteroides sp.]
MDTITRSYERSAQMSLFRQVYLWMAMALAITGMMALLVAGSPTMLSLIFSSKLTFFALIIAEIALVWYLSARIERLSFTTATLMFIVYSLLNGAMLSSIFILYTATSIASTFFVTAGTFGVMCVYGYLTKRDLTSIGNICLMAVIGLIIAGLVNLFLQSSVMSLIISGIGVLVFVGLTAYDSQKIKQLLLQEGMEVNDSTKKIALLGSLTLYLDFINLFLYLLRFLGDRRN